MDVVVGKSHERVVAGWQFPDGDAAVLVRVVVEFAGVVVQGTELKFERSQADVAHRCVRRTIHN
jgi:hypothetical protein